MVSLLHSLISVNILKGTLIRYSGGDKNMGTIKQNPAVNIENLENRVSEIVSLLEKARLDDYVDLMTNKKRRLYIGFAEGLVRGFGMAIGFTLLGALALFLMRQIVMLNLPIIGDFIAELVKIVQDNL